MKSSICADGRSETILHAPGAGAHRAARKEDGSKEQGTDQEAEEQEGKNCHGKQERRMVVIFLSLVPSWLGSIRLVSRQDCRG